MDMLDITSALSDAICFLVKYMYVCDRYMYVCIWGSFLLICAICSASTGQSHKGAIKQESEKPIDT